MAKDGFSAAEIFNTRVEDEYSEEPIRVNEEIIDNELKENGVDTEESIEEEIPPISAPQNEEEPSATGENESVDDEEPFTFGEDEPEEEKRKKIDLGAIASMIKLPKIKIPKITLPEKKKPVEEVKPVEEKIEEKIPEEPETPKSRKKRIIFTSVMAVAAALVFILFGVFLLEQYKMVMPSHDDYGYATLSYVYWEDGMWGQNFSMDQLVHYLTQHYNKWGGRVLSFGQSILLLREGLDVAQGFHAITLGATFLLAFLFAQNGKKTKLLPVAALFTVSMFGFIGKNISISGFYWYCAAILYTVPILYVFIGAWLMYAMLLDKREGFATVPKLMMLPFATVIFFFAGFSMEQIGIFAVVTSASMLVYACFKRRNPITLVYGVPPMLAAIAGCHIMLNAVGNNSRKNGYADYYALSFSEQILKSGDNIAKTLFSSANILMVIVLALVSVCAAAFIVRKRKNVFSYILLGVNSILASLSVAVSANNVVGENISKLMWGYLIVMAITVTIWLFMSKRKQDYLLWALFFGSLASQAACLISPIYPGRCLMMFILTLVAIASRAFNEVLCIFEGMERKKAFTNIFAITAIVVMIGVTGAGQVYHGFKENDRVQQYNDKMLQVTGKMYDEYGVVVEEIPLMRLKNDTYAGSTQPYGRDLIKDWMKIYYKLPPNLEYADFLYEEYDEDRLEDLEELLTETENKYNELKNNA